MVPEGYRYYNTYCNRYYYVNYNRIMSSTDIVKHIHFTYTVKVSKMGQFPRNVSE